MHVTPRPPAQRLAVPMLGYGHLMHGIGSAPQQLANIRPVHARHGRQSAEVHKRRGQIDVFHERVANPTHSRNARHPPEHRHPTHGLRADPGGLFLKAKSRAVRAVVGVIDDNRIFGQAALVEIVQQAANAVVNLRHTAQIAAPYIARPFLRRPRLLRPSPLKPRMHVAEMRRASRWILVIGRRQCEVGRIHIPELLIRRIGRVWARQRDLHTEGVARAPLHKFKRPIHAPTLDIVLQRQVRQPGAELVLRQANGMEGGIAGDAEVVVLLQQTGTGQKRLIRRQTTRGRHRRRGSGHPAVNVVQQPIAWLVGHVGLADYRCLVPVLPKMAEETLHPLRARPAQTEETVIVAVLPGIDAHAAGRTNWVLGVRSRKARPLAGQPI